MKTKICIYDCRIILTLLLFDLLNLLHHVSVYLAVFVIVLILQDFCLLYEGSCINYTTHFNKEGASTEGTLLCCII